MMMYSRAAAAPAAMRHHLRRRRDDEYDMSFMHPTPFTSFSPTSCPQPHKKFKVSMQDHLGYSSRFQQQPAPTMPSTWYQSADISSPDSDDMDTSMDVDMLDDNDFDDVPTPEQWNERNNDTQVVQYTQPNGASKQHTTLEVIGSHKTPFKPRPVLIPSTRIEEVNDEPTPCNALVVYRPLPPAGSWKVEPESESDDETCGGTVGDVDDGEMMEID